MPIESTRRILDANFNRAREALRVMEEYARFLLDDASLTEEIKRTRHDLSEAIRGFGERAPRSDEATKPERDEVARDPSRGSLVAYRDIVGDVGREATTASEYRRSDAAEVATAACRRLSEALRVLEEYGKTIEAESAAAIEGLRYRGYDIERRLFVTGRARERFGAVRLYVLLTESLCGGAWFATAEASLRGGADCIQLREKHLSDRELLERARRLAALCRAHGAVFIVNDRPDIAAGSGADGVHVGQDDLPIAAARRMLPGGSIIGVSTHTVEQAEAAIAEGPDYIAVGPMFDSSTKPQSHIAGVETLALVRERTSLPVAAIGGIDATNVRLVMESGADCVCVSGAIIGASDAAAATARMRGVIEAVRSRR